MNVRTMAHDPTLGTFNVNYEKIWGSRWPELQAALLAQTQHVALQSPYNDVDGDPYEVDPASLVPVDALEISPGDEVMDLCAAPGGKAIALCYRYDIRSFNLAVNEPSKPRFFRLKNNLTTYLRSHVDRIQFLSKKGELLYRTHANRFDRILVDAPCSSERHLFNNPMELAKWSPNRTRSLAIRQIALLSSAFEMLKPGGILVYSTCSISLRENEEVIERLCKKRDSRVEVLEFKHDLLEPLSVGGIVLPDRSGSGPIYVAKIKKTA